MSPARSHPARGAPQPFGVPFFYGWVVVFCACCSAVARQGVAVATLSVFVGPMIAEFDWSRSGISGAVSLGGLLGALTAPRLGRLADRSGARMLLTVSALVTGGSVLALAGTNSLLWFYVAFGIGRMTFAGPFDIGITTAIANWFVRRRGRAMSVVTLVSGLGLAAMPMLAQLAIEARGWRFGWLVLAVSVLVIGALPVAILMRRRPEDLGLRPDGMAPPESSGARLAHARDRAGDAHAPIEPEFTSAEALRTPAAWLLMAYSACFFAVQAGMSLHQAPYLVEKGIAPTLAATVVATFSTAAALGSLLFGWIGDRWPIRFGLATAAIVSLVGLRIMLGVEEVGQAYLAALTFGGGVGGLMTLLPVAWAAYFGRRNFGAIRGITLPVQVIGQASGPLIAGSLYDLSGDYGVALNLFSVLAALAAAMALCARVPQWRAPPANGNSH
ncbi:MAG: MFS transporter [Gammaproteobacteria bacterium]|nr:MFS transporter [Gammaproteobacteria bacterium]